MSYITLKCKNCGANMSLNTESHSATCNHCSSTFLISELLDEKDSAFISKLSSKEIEQKMLANDSIKKGETCLIQCDFENAETYFKKAIENDDSNFRSYLGVVKAKTQNLNKLPENDDYLQYAHYALSLATGDDLVLVKSELSKIDLLYHEKRRQKRIFLSTQKKEENIRKHNKEVSKVFSLIAIFIILMFGGFIFISSMFSGVVFYPTNNVLSVNIDTYEELSEVFSSNQYLNYNINLTTDIDCKGNTLSPLGTKTKPFTGKFNGGNHTISNAVIKDANTGYVGLFGHTSLASINNLVLDNISIDSSSNSENLLESYYGLLTGKSESTSISNIEIKNTCSISISKDITAPISIGGLIGSISSSCFVSKISSHAVLSISLTQTLHPANSYIGGIIGLSSNSTIESTCSNSSILLSNINTNKTSSISNISGIVGLIQTPSVTDISGFTHNYFSGDLNVTTSNYITATLSAIANSSLKLNKSLNNSCLYKTTNFKLNSYYISLSKLSDYTEKKYFTYFDTANDQYLSKLSETFSGWNYSDTFEPSLI